ncbi:unnamed protein product [Cunninghamella echinulata]
MQNNGSHSINIHSFHESDFIGQSEYSFEKAPISPLRKMHNNSTQPLTRVDHRNNTQTLTHINHHNSTQPLTRIDNRLLFNEEEDGGDQQSKKKARIIDDSHQSHSTNVVTDELREENRRLRSRILELEVAATRAENKFMEISALDSDVEKKLYDYQLKTNKEFEVFDDTVRDLYIKAEKKEKEVLELKDQLEKSHLKLEKQIIATKDDMNSIPQNEGVKKYKDEYYHREKAYRELQDEYNELQNEYQLLFTNHPKSKVLEGICSTHLIQGLEDKVKFYSKFTGLEVLNHEATQNGDEIICRQHGYIGSLTFKLTTNNDDETKITYQPLLEENDTNVLLKYLPDYFTEEIQFKKQDSDLFIWRLLTHLNKK